MNEASASAPDPGTTAESAREIRRLVGAQLINELTRRSDAWGLLFLFGHAALLGATGYLLWRSLGSYWAVPATLLHGIVIVHLFAPFHEATHNTAFRSQWLNTLVGWLTGLALMLPPLVFRYQHGAHHRYTQDVERDPQMIPMGERLGGFLFYASAIPYFREILRALLSQPRGRFNESERRNVPVAKLGAVQRQARAFWAVYAALAIGSVWAGSWAVAIFWLLPRVLAEPLERIIRMSEHVGCARNANMLQNTRTVLTWAPIRWLSWNMALHTAHHAAPLVPFHALPRMHAALAGHIEELRRGYVDTVRFQLRNASRRTA